MSKASLDQTSLENYVKRLEALSPETSRKWGTLTPSQLLPHLRWLIEVSLEEIHAEDMRMPLARTRAVQWLVLNVPWPKGKLKAPEGAVTASPGDFAEEREALVQAMQRFAEAATREPERMTRSPLMGPLPLKFWARLHGKHLEHHFEQFGV